MMKVRLTLANSTHNDHRPPTVHDYTGVLDVEVEYADPEHRTQAERNADNALAAARLLRVEAALRESLNGLDSLEKYGAVKVATKHVRAMLTGALEAPVS